MLGDGELKSSKGNYQLFVAKSIEISLFFIIVFYLAAMFKFQKAFISNSNSKHGFMIQRSSTTLLGTIFLPLFMFSYSINTQEKMANQVFLAKILFTTVTIL